MTIEQARKATIQELNNQLAIVGWENGCNFTDIKEAKTQVATLIYSTLYYSDKESPPVLYDKEEAVCAASLQETIDSVLSEDGWIWSGKYYVSE